MTVCLLVIHDGRSDYLEQTLASAASALPDFDQRVTIDDCDHNLGFAGAIQAGWDQVETDHIFHLEGDFTFNQPVPVDEMVDLLVRQPRLAQVALKRQAVNMAERACGGVVEVAPDDFIERCDRWAVWTEHRRFFTTNPSVYPARLCRLGWPQEPRSEGVFTHRLLRDPLLWFAYWGHKLAPPTVHHIGEERTGVGY